MNKEDCDSKKKKHNQTQDYCENNLDYLIHSRNSSDKSNIVSNEQYIYCKPNLIRPANLLDNNLTDYDEEDSNFSNNKYLNIEDKIQIKKDQFSKENNEYRNKYEALMQKYNKHLKENNIN